MTIWTVAKTRLPGDVRGVYTDAVAALSHRGRKGLAIFKLMPDGRLLQCQRWVTGAGWRYY